MKRERIKGFILGVLVTVIIFTSIIITAANNITETFTKQITYGISVNLNGQSVTFDEDMRPFVMDSRTFLSLRAIGEILGLEVDFDEDTNTAILEEWWYTASQSQSQPELPEKILPELPEHIDFNGYVFNFLTHEDYTRELHAAEEIGDIINDSVYIRNTRVEDNYNIEIKTETCDDEFIILRRIVVSADDLFGAVLLRNSNIFAAVTRGLLHNTAKLPYIDLDKPWWDPAVSALSVGGKNFVLGGDMLLSDKAATSAILFNKALIQDYGLEKPFNLVKEGKWTMDKFSEYIIHASTDLNGDGKMTPFDDRFGLVCFDDTLHSLFVSGDGTLAGKDADDLPFMDFVSIDGLNVLDKVMGIMYNKNFVLNAQNIDEYNSAFEEYRALFMAGTLKDVERFRRMEPDFGILPLPKFDETQERYRSAVSPVTGALLGVPIIADNAGRTGIILEAMAAESRYMLLPAYYENLLMTKFYRDEESAEMLDIIFDNKIYDPGAVYNFGDLYSKFIDLASASNKNVVSFYDSISNDIYRNIDRLIILTADLQE